MTNTPSNVNLTWLKIVKDILKEEGIKGLYRGALMWVMYLSVGGMAFFGIYEEVKSMLIKHE